MKTEDFDKELEQKRVDSLQAKFLHGDSEEDELKYQTILAYCEWVPWNVVSQTIEISENLIHRFMMESLHIHMKTLENMFWETEKKQSI